MAADTPPTDRLLSGPLFWAVIEGGSPILPFPRHLEDVGTILHGLDTQTTTKRAASQIDDKLLYGQTEGFLLRLGQLSVVAVKVWQ